jgi:hypothetical protein
LRNENKLTADQIERVDLKVHPLVLELTGKKTPREGLEGKFSIYHAVAVALVEGAGGEKQFSDRAVNDPTIVALRAKVNPVITPGIDAAQVDMTVVLKDGRQLHRYIEHAIGSATRNQVFGSGGRHHSGAGDPPRDGCLLERREFAERRRNRENVGLGLNAVVVLRRHQSRETTYWDGAIIDLLALLTALPTCSAR